MFRDVLVAFFIYVKNIFLGRINSKKFHSLKQEMRRIQA
ncbi:hypothetical protein RV11_GL000045 [Enterococcus phoeniculicola]|nr:hypothetical protein RV11_GL000045 [Enterococcus phoeniculicola]